MQVENVLYCNQDCIRFVREDNLKNSDGSFNTLSVTDLHNTELMIFLGRNDQTLEYEVRVYKHRKWVKYKPEKEGDVKRYVVGEKYDTFYFDNFFDALKFVCTLGYIHPEYKKRPIRKIK